MLAVVVVYFGDKATRDQSEQQCDAIEHESDRSFDSGVRQIFLAFIA